MNFLSLIASLTQRAAVVSEQVLDRFNVPPFMLGDAFDGKITVVSETGDPTAPTQDVALDSASAVSLTDGRSVVYAEATGIAISNINEVDFTMVVDGVDLLAALALVDIDTIEAFLEVRITKDSQDILLLREPVVIARSATAP